MIKEKVLSVLCEVFGLERDSINLETSIINDIGADSLDVVELITTLEEKIGFRSISEEEMASIDTVGSLVECVERLVSEK